MQNKCDIHILLCISRFFRFFFFFFFFWIAIASAKYNKSNQVLAQSVRHFN
ncbi:hypothetical protein Hanom_Chr02g00130031 [Helianthus anomalus]